MGEYDIRDKWGRKVGSLTPDDPGGTCAMFVLGVIGFVIFFVIFVAVQIVQEVTKPPPPKPHYMALPDVQRSGPFAPVSLPSEGNGMKSGSALTYTPIKIARDGTYTLFVYSRGVFKWKRDTPGSTRPPAMIKGTYTYKLLVIVNKEVLAKVDMTEAMITLQYDVHLLKGDNTIQVKVEGTDAYDNGESTYVSVVGIDLEEKTSPQDA